MDEPESKKPGEKRLKGIKTGVFSRGLALAKVSVSAGARVASHAVGNLFVGDDEKAERYKAMVTSQMRALTQEFGKLKGSLMKVGQLLSMHGEHFLPPEANALLKSLQSQSPPLEWKEIEKALKRQLSAELLDTVEIETSSVASASLGQVHKARRKSDGRWLAMKIQYPGVDRAIEGDLKTLKSVLTVANLLPKGPKFDELFTEVRSMLHQEVDYSRELQNTLEYKKNIASLTDGTRYVVPEVFSELSTRRVLTTSFETGYAVDSPEVLSISQDRRNQLGIAMVELYFHELFDWATVQTDPHLGNYRVRLGEGEKPDQLILLDFGAVRKLPGKFLRPYLEMIRGCLSRDGDQILRGAKELDFIREEDSDELKQIFTELCFMIAEPFYTASTPGVRSDLFEADGSYRWGDSDLSKRVARKGAEFVFTLKLRPPPREVIFLDRKMGGVFVFLSVLKVRLNGPSIAKKYIH